jgi:TatD DNase family protein
VIDSHCHLTHPRLAADVGTLLAAAAAAGVRRCVTIGTGVEDATRCLDLARRHTGVDCTAGIDPFSAHRAGERFDDELAALADLLDGRGFRAVGEIGLDYHYDLDPRPVQRARFVAQLDLAEARDLPVVIHVREAHADLLDLLAGRKGHGVVHSFSAGPAEAERYVDLGWHLGFTGVVTFPSAHALREAARAVPRERMLVETDSPYLAPVPRRGSRCEPAYLVHTVAALATLRAEDPADLARQTERNTIALFGLEV